MTPATITTATVPELVDRLAAHRTLGSAPRRELEWLATHGVLARFEPGEVVLLKNQPVEFMFIQLSGRVSTVIERGTGRRHVLQTQGGDVGAALPFSRGKVSLGEVTVDEPTEGLGIHRDLFPELIRECPTVVEELVHVMIDRSRVVTTTSLQDDKMMALGRLSAGLAHELNNPASAAARSAKLLAASLAETRQASQALGAEHLTEPQRERVDALAAGFLPATTGVFSAIERSDREDEIAEWLDRRKARLAPAQALAESGITIDALEEIADAFGGDTLDVVLRWLATEITTRSLAGDVERSATRIYDLVMAVKRFTYMDRAATAEPTNVTQGLTDTVAVLASKARAKSAAIRLDIAPNLPSVSASAGGADQIWSNLIDNALDAIAESGTVWVSARPEGKELVVRVVDDGPGIPPGIQDRIFDPFFTTKPIGQGTGLGLDISLRIIRNFGGQIALDSQPGRTEFRVALPIDSSR